MVRRGNESRLAARVPPDDRSLGVRCSSSGRRPEGMGAVNALYDADRSPGPVRAAAHGRRSRRPGQAGISPPARPVRRSALLRTWRQYENAGSGGLFPGDRPERPEAPRPPTAPVRRGQPFHTLAMTGSRPPSSAAALVCGAVQDEPLPGGRPDTHGCTHCVYDRRAPLLLHGTQPGRRRKLAQYGRWSRQVGSESRQAVRRRG